MVVIQKDEENQPGLGVGGEGFEMPHGTPLSVLPTTGDSKLNVSALLKQNIGLICIFLGGVIWSWEKDGM